MPMTKQKQLGEPAGGDRGEILKDDRLADTVSAYIDGQLSGEELEKFKALLESNVPLAREVQDMRDIELQLMEMGSDILSEQVPEALLEAFKRLERR
jgi:anti-sigma factor RsiW